uniref:Replication factor C subunit 3 n=1 Tax=Schistocephalus solidus TaxID=70667 RepID=A0A0X3PZ23_SCHSO
MVALSDFTSTSSGVRCRRIGATCTIKSYKRQNPLIAVNAPTSEISFDRWLPENEVGHVRRETRGCPGSLLLLKQTFVLDCSQCAYARSALVMLGYCSRDIACLSTL